MPKGFIVFFAMLFATAFAFAGESPSFASEDTDWGVPPTTKLRTSDYHAKTPTTVPGATTIKTVGLAAEMEQHDHAPPLLFDVLEGDPQKRKVIPGAILLGFEAGNGYSFSVDSKRFANMLARETNGDKNREIVFYCLSSKCWLSYNASIEAVELGYTRVHWFRGGVDAWIKSGRFLIQAVPYVW